jgi:arsenate reductase
MNSTNDSKKGNQLLPALHITLNFLVNQFNLISVERKNILGELTRYVQYRRESNQEVNLNFICTHNSRRSHIAQLWAQTAAFYFGVDGVKCFSGGTEATAFNSRAVKAMKEAGFEIAQIEKGDNPLYEVHYSDLAPLVIAFSKKYDDEANPKSDFAAIMTCSHADENCPLVLGASARIAITYDDPKDFDGTPQEDSKYKERVLQIGREMLYAFSRITT